MSQTMLEIAIKAAKAAGQLQREKFGTDISVKKKGDIDLVTEVDIECEQIIRSVIERLAPGTAILGEEEGKGGGSGSDLWIVDPLDGTTNYAHAIPIFCVSIGFESAGRIVAGVVYDPMRDELFAASEGGPATLNGDPIMVTSRPDIDSCVLATGFPYDIRTNERDIFGALETMAKAGQGIRRLGAAALDLAYVAAGRFDGFWEVGLKPWDVAAGRLLVERAGGRVSGFKGEAYDHHCPDILATNGLIHKTVLELLSKHF